MSKVRTHYDNLKIARNAPDAIIRAAYKTLMQQYHPDKFQGSKQDADRIAKLIKKSYDILIDPITRAEHDRWIDEQEEKAKESSHKAQFNPTNGAKEQEFYEREERQEKSKAEPPPQPKNSKPTSTNNGTDNLKIATRWRRFFARIFDVWWEIIIVAFTLGFALSWSASFNEWLNQPSANYAFNFICLPIALIFDTLIYSTFGNTPGKAWLGLKVLKLDSNDLNFGEYLKRNFSFLKSGFAFGVPLFNLYTMGKQSERLKNGQQTSYDESDGFHVWAQPSGLIRKMSFTVAFTLLFSAQAILTSLNNVIARREAKQNAVPEVSAQNNPYEFLDNINPAQVDYKPGLFDDVIKPKPVRTTNIENELRRASDLYNQGRYAEVLPIYQDLAKKGNPHAQSTLGTMYSGGIGVPANNQVAVYWYTKAAEQGHSDAQSNLGVMYNDGTGVQQNNILAYMWFNISASEGNENGRKFRNWMAQKMTSTQIQQAQNLASEWIKSHPKRGLFDEYLNKADKTEQQHNTVAQEDKIKNCPEKKLVFFHHRNCDRLTNSPPYYEYADCVLANKFYSDGQAVDCQD